MIYDVKPIESLTIADLKAAPVWQYANRDGVGETVVRPISRVPVKNMTGKLVGTQVRLANGTQAWALVGNVDSRKPRLTKHFLTLSIERDGRWFSLARYHDFDYSDRGPNALSRFLGVTVEEIFPIDFDIQQYVEGDPAALKGQIQVEPDEKLSRAEIIAMAVP